MARFSSFVLLHHFFLSRSICRTSPQPYRIFSTSSSLLQMRFRKEISTQNVTSTKIPVIRVPQAMAAKIEQALQLKQIKERRIRSEKWSLQARTVIIQCKRKERNFHLGQSTNKYEAPLLASQSWKSKRSAGDHFTIKAMGASPAMKDCDLDDVPGFQKFELHRAVMDAVEDMKLTVCTNIQNQAIPMILQGDNVICAAETGSGKTLAYLIPLVHKLILEKEADVERSATDFRLNTPRALILVPSRELAQQVYDVLVRLLAFTNLNPQLIIGGERTQKKLNNPTFGVVDVIVSTPGVLSKLITNRLQNVSFATTVVIDEADTLVDDSFSQVIRRIMTNVGVQGGGEEGSAMFSRGAQLILVGATMPRSLSDTLEGLVPVESLTRVTTKFLHRVMPHIKQTFHRTKPSQKSTMILDLVKNGLTAGQTIMIFCRNNETCDWLSRFLEENGIIAPNLNGAMLQRIRRGRFEQFQRGEFRCLVCTDIASRGLDTTFVNHVINYDFPQDISDYIHRTGRTGRVGSTDAGLVTSFVTYPDEVEVVHKIEKAVRDAAQYQNVNANITRRISVKHGMTTDDVKEIKKL